MSGVEALVKWSSWRAAQGEACAINGDALVVGLSETVSDDELDLVR